MELVVEMPAYLKVLENEQILEGCQNMEERNGIKYASHFYGFSLGSDHSQKPHLTFKSPLENYSLSGLKNQMTVLRSTAASGKCMWRVYAGIREWKIKILYINSAQIFGRPLNCKCMGQILAKDRTELRCELPFKRWNFPFYKLIANLKKNRINIL